MPASYEELTTRNAQLQQVVAEQATRNAELEAMVRVQVERLAGQADQMAQQADRIAQLERQLGADSSNSSLPPSSDPPWDKDKKAAPKTKVAPGQRLAKIGADKRPHEEKIRELFLVTYSREQNQREVAALMAHVRRQSDVRAAYEDVLWVLVNSEEFLFNH